MTNIVDTFTIDVWRKVFESAACFRDLNTITQLSRTTEEAFNVFRTDICRSFLEKRGYDVNHPHIQQIGVVKAVLTVGRAFPTGNVEYERRYFVLANASENETPEIYQNAKTFFKALDDDLFSPEGIVEFLEYMARTSQYITYTREMFHRLCNVINANTAQYSDINECIIRVKSLCSLAYDMGFLYKFRALTNNQRERFLYERAMWGVFDGVLEDFYNSDEDLSHFVRYLDYAIDVMRVPTDIVENQLSIPNVPVKALKFAYRQAPTKFKRLIVLGAMYLQLQNGSDYNFIEDAVEIILEDFSSENRVMTKLAFREFIDYVKENNYIAQRARVLSWGPLLDAVHNDLP
jgi:hypothetical protein